MRTCLQALGLALLALWMGCADFEKAEQGFCERNPDRCGIPSGGDGGPTSYSRLAFTTAPQTVQVGNCSEVTTVQLQDTRDSPVSATTDTAVALSAAPPEGFQFFTEAGCTGTAVTSVGIRAGSNSASFYFKGTRAGAATLNASTGGIFGSQGMALTHPPPAAIALSVPTSPVAVGTCTSATVQVKDANGSDSRVSAATPVSLLAVPTGGIAFYSDAGCTTAASSVTLAAGEGSATFYFQGQIEGNVTINATATGLTQDSKTAQLLPGAGNRLVFTSVARTVTAGACSQAVQFQSRDAQGNPAPVSAATAVTLAASPATSFKFYSDASCTNEVVTGIVTLAQGSTTGGFYFKGTQSGTVTLTLTASGLTGSSQLETINPGSPTAMVFTGPQTLQAGDCSAPVTIELRDAHGNTATAAANTTINLTTSGVPLTYSTNSGCTPTTTNVVVPQNASSVSFRYRGTQAGTATLSGTSSGLAPTPLVVTVTTGPATELVFTTSAQTVTAGNCSAVATVQLRDAFNNAVRVSVNTAVGLSAAPSTGFQFFADSSCTGAAVTSVNMPAGASDARFYFKGTRSGTPVVSASVSGLPAATQNATINPAAPTVLAFSPLGLTVLAGNCTQVTLRATDTFGNLSNVPSNQVVDLTANPSAGFTFSTANTCSPTTTQATINSGQNSVTLYVRGTVAGSVTVTASRTGFSNGTLAMTVNAGAPNKLAFQTAPQTLEVGACSGITTVQVQDSFNNPTPVGSNTQINLSGSTGTITFYSDAGCTNTTASATVPSSQSNASFYFKDSNAEPVTITAASSGLTSATQQQTINPLTPTALAFVTAPQTVPATACSGIATVETRAGGTPATVTTSTTVGLNAAPATGFTFYSNSNCTTVVTSVTIAVGQGSANFYFKGTAPGTVTLTASSTGLTSATQNATITPLPTKLLFTTPAHTTTAGVCSALVTVQTADGSNSAAPVATNTTVNLTQSGAPSDLQFRFYSDASCGTAVTSISIPAGQSVANFYYKGEKVRTVTLAAAATGLTSATQNHTMVAGSAASLAFSTGTAAQTLLAGACSGIRTVESRDAFGNPATNSVTVNFNGSTTAEFFLDLNCTTPVSQITIPGGNSSASFYFKGFTGGINANGPLTLTASATGLTSATQIETIIPTVRTGSCVIANTNVTCDITPALLDTSKAFLVFQATSPNATSDQTNVRCFLNSTSQVRCDRTANAGSNVNIRWSVAEFPLGVNVQHQPVNCSNDTTNVVLSNNVTMDRTFLLLSSQRNSPTMDSSVPRLVELTSATQAEIRKTGGCGGGVTDNNHLQAVDFVGAAAQRGLASMANGATSTEVNLPSSVVLDRSILLYSYLSDGSGLTVCDRVLRGELTEGGAKVTFSRGDGDTVTCANSQFSAISWEVVQFPVGTVVHQVTQPLTGAAASATIPAVDLSRTIVIGGGQWASGQLHGEGRHLTSELISEMRAQAYLTDSTTLSFFRETSNNSARFTAYVVQFKP